MTSETRFDSERSGTSCAAPAMSPRAGGDAPPAGLATMIEQAKWPSSAELCRLLGDQWAELSARQRHDLAARLWGVRLARGVLAVIRPARGELDATLRELLPLIVARLGRSVSLATLSRWRRQYRRLGVRGLLDLRGRPRGCRRPVSPVSLVEFLERLAAGESVCVAHRRTLKRALSAGRQWPRSLPTIRAMLADGAVRLQEPPRERKPRGQRDYLVKGQSLS